MNKTKIEWCDSTWNPVTGCLHGCEYCYARKMTNRFGREVLDRAEESKNGLHCLYSRVECNPYPYLFEPTYHAYRFDEPQKWKKPRTIFVCSMADLFGDWVPDDWITSGFAACKDAPQHRYLFLTKNPKRYAELFEADKLPLEGNMWYGASAATPEQAEETEKWFGKLPLSPKPANSFLSVEPMLFDITKSDAWQHLCRGWYANWIIVGAETGNRKDKVVPQKEWINSIAADCTDYGIPIFMKNSLLPIVREENMRREFPWAADSGKGGIK